jgi:hypothetical protein
MQTQRTGGMTAIGILNIIFGSLGSIMSLLVIVGGGIFAALGGAGMAADNQGGGDSGAGAVAAVGAIVLVIGVLMLLCNVLLMVAGIGVLKLAPWGRILSMVGGGAMALLGVLSMIGGDFGLMTIFMVGYGGMLVGLFCKTEWKAAFSTQDGQDLSMQQNYSQPQDRMRHAA